MEQEFKALVVRQVDDKTYTKGIEKRTIDDLPDGSVLIRVQYSSLNYKDALSCNGNRGVTRHYPHTPGIDAAGIVEFSGSNNFNPGDSVVVISYDLGQNTPGGFGQFIRVPSSWVMPLTKGMSLYESMIYGTAGFTAGLAIDKLQRQGISPENGPIIVTGATGGVGSISIALLSGLGYYVIASTGKKDADIFLKRLGALKVIDRKALSNKLGFNLLKEEWAGAIDSVGGNTLATLLKSCKQNGAVVSVGLVESSDLNITVFPFILRGVSLLGLSASETTMEDRKKIWEKLSNEWKPDNLNKIEKYCSLENLSIEIDKIYKGTQKGRVVVDMRSTL
jgi:putative YhdH/YhfP family quinone oxidoreductase